jgi:hypothetical protein
MMILSTGDGGTVSKEWPQAARIALLVVMFAFVGVVVLALVLNVLLH